MVDTVLFGHVAGLDQLAYEKRPDDIYYSAS